LPRTTATAPTAAPRQARPSHRGARSNPRSWGSRRAPTRSSSAATAAVPAVRRRRVLVAPLLDGRPPRPHLAPGSLRTLIKEPTLKPTAHMFVG